MADEAPEPPEGRKHWRKLKRQDTGLALFDAVRSSLRDLERARPLLRELTRLYNPLVNGPLIDPPTHARIIEALEAGQIAEAERLLDDRLALYAPGDSGAADPGRYRGGAGPFRDL